MLQEEEELRLSSLDSEVKQKTPSLEPKCLATDFQKKIDLSQWLNWWRSQGTSDKERYENVLEYCLKDNRYHAGLILVIGHRIQDLFLCQHMVSPMTSFPAFVSENPPPISISDYFYKLVRGSGSDLSTAVLSAFMIQKFHFMYPEYRIDSFRIHKVVLGAVMASHKYLEEDQPRSNRAFATMCNLELKMVSLIEAEFLFAVGFDIEEDNFYPVLGQLFEKEFQLKGKIKEKRKSDYVVGLGMSDCFD